MSMCSRFTFWPSILILKESSALELSHFSIRSPIWIHERMSGHSLFDWIPESSKTIEPSFSCSFVSAEKLLIAITKSSSKLWSNVPSSWISEQEISGALMTSTPVEFFFVLSSGSDKNEADSIFSVFVSLKSKCYIIENRYLDFLIILIT